MRPDDKKNSKTGKQSLDYFLLHATVAVLFALSAICIFSMFYFKFADVQQMSPVAKIAYQNRMNQLVTPFVIMLILLLGVCVPKRLLSARWLVRFGIFLGLTGLGMSLWKGLGGGLILVLTASLALQLVVLVLAVAGSRHLHFEKSGYWVRIGSSLIHLGLILFVLDLLLYKHMTLHLVLFWVTTGSSVLGMLLCFYSQHVAAGINRIRLSLVKTRSEEEERQP